MAVFMNGIAQPISVTRVARVNDYTEQMKKDGKRVTRVGAGKWVDYDEYAEQVKCHPRGRG